MADKIRLVPPSAPFLKGRMLVASDCNGFACLTFIVELLSEDASCRCPKFDDIEDYTNRFTEIFRVADIRACCGGYGGACCSKMPLTSRSNERARKYTHGNRDDNHEGR
jgi:hypothetical protein